jgi:hypothetical protein
MGSSYTRAPVALNTAFAMAGATDGRVFSPTPCDLTASGVSTPQHPRMKHPWEFQVDREPDATVDALESIDVRYSLAYIHRLFSSNFEYAFQPTPYQYLYQLATVPCRSAMVF